MAKKGIGLTVPAPDKEMMDYRARDDLETLRRAEEIKMDRHRHSAAKKVATVHARALSKIRGR